MQGFHSLKKDMLDATVLYEQMLQKFSGRETVAFEQAVHTILGILTGLDQQVGAGYKQLQRGITTQDRNRLLYEAVSKWGEGTDHRCKPSFTSFCMG